MGAEASNFQYTVEVPGSAKPGQTGIFLHPQAKPYLTTGLKSGAKTVYEIFENSVKLYPDLPFLGTRCESIYVWKTYKQVFELSCQLGLFLVSIGMTASSHLGIFSKNREEWIITDLACASQSIVSVPLYEMLQESDLQAIISETELRAIACPSYLLPKLFKYKQESKIPNLSLFIVFDNISPDHIQEANEIGVGLYQYSNIFNSSFTGPATPPSPSSIYTICYTSGTTGRRKGAMITHSNVIATIAGVSSLEFSFNNTDSHLSYLPLAHMMERVFFINLIEVGARTLMC
jgi:long-chain acyl-CoA synthetase